MHVVRLEAGPHRAPPPSPPGCSRPARAAPRRAGARRASRRAQRCPAAGSKVRCSAASQGRAHRPARGEFLVARSPDRRAGAAGARRSRSRRDATGPCLAQDLAARGDANTHRPGSTAPSSWRSASRPMRARARRAPHRTSSRAPGSRRRAPRRTGCRGAVSCSGTRDVESAMAGKRHLEQRREQAAVGAIVIRSTRSARLQRGDALEEPAAAAAGRRGQAARRRVPPYTCARLEPPSRLRPRPDRSTAGASRRDRVRSCGVSVRRTSATGANAETISDTGATTACSASRPRATPSSSTANPCRPEWRCRAPDTAPCPRPCTAAYSAASSPGSPQAAIQLADRRTCDERAISAARMLVIASATAMRAGRRPHRAAPAACARPWPWPRRCGRV